MGISARWHLAQLACLTPFECGFRSVVLTSMGCLVMVCLFCALRARLALFRLIGDQVLNVHRFALDASLET